MLFAPFKSIMPQETMPQINGGMPNPLSSHDAIIDSLMDLARGKSNGDPDDIDIKDSAGLKSGKFPKDKIQNLIKASKVLGVDPNEALGIALQENSFAQATTKVRGRKRATTLGTVNDDLFSESQLKAIDGLTNQGYDRDSVKLAYALKAKNEYARQLGFNDDAARLQAYNGYGTITPAHFGGATKAYGVDITNGVNLKKNPLYGKRIMQLKSDLQKNKAIADLIKVL